MFETKEEIERELKAMDTYIKKVGGSYRKLAPTDIDFRLFDDKGNIVGYAEVKGRMRTIRDAYPLPIAARKVVKLCDKRLNPIIIWACLDGIIYGSPMEIKGETSWGGRTDRPNVRTDTEMMMYFKKQPTLRYINFDY